MSHSPVGAHAPRDRRRVAPHMRSGGARWPSFISWRWAGPGLDGWTRCPWRAPPLQLPPPRLRRSATSMSRRRLGQNPPAAGAAPARRQPSGRPRKPARRQPGRAPERALASPLREPNRLRRVPGGPLGRAPASPPRGRALADLPPGNGRRRAGAGGGGRPSSGFPAGPGPRRS
jgi:hypothetical protein